MLRLGTTLPNGATVIAIKPSDIRERSIALCLRPDDICCYVTWLVDDNGNAYLGHYFLTIQDAAKNFTERC